MKHLFSTLIFLVAFTLQNHASSIWYVKTSGSDANAGSTWNTAFQTIQKAINTASPNDEIWVAEGTYLPTEMYNGTTEQHKTFFIGKDLKIYGGFRANGSPWNQRDWNAYPTILSGDLGMQADISDNAYHVVWIEGRSSAMELDGFTITQAKLYFNDGVNSFGGGIYNNADHQDSKPSIRNCIITDNEGGQFTHGAGMYNRGYYGKASPTITDCTFSNNNVPGNSEGGAMYNYAFGLGGFASPVMNDCNFTNNYAAYRGGAIYDKVENDGNSAPILTNCNFEGNRANAQTGGAIYHSGLALTLNSCNFIENSAFIAGGVYVLYGDLKATDCTFSNNTATVGAGAMQLQSANSISKITRCTFSNNSAATNGGAVSIYAYLATVNVTIDKCIFSGNSAANGGAIYTEGASNSSLIHGVINCLFFDNTASERGGAVCRGRNDGNGYSYYFHCSFYHNMAGISGGAVGTSGFPNGSLEHGMKNCITWGNSSTFGQTASGQGTLSISNSLIQEASCPPGTSCTLCYHNVNPQFVNPGANDFHLEGCSAAVNSGDNQNALPDDLEGNPRPSGIVVDMGAYEYTGIPIVLEAKCKNITVSLNAAGSVNVPAANINDESTGCPPLAFKINDQTAINFNCDQLGPQTVTLKVTDNKNQTLSCTAVITVADQLAPTMLCKPATITLNAAGQASLSVAQVDNGSYDNCAIVTKVLGQSTFNCDNVGVNSVILGGVDASNNKGTCTATVTVKDPIAPVAKCKSITANLAADGTVYVSANSVDNGSTDNCSLNLSLSPYSFNCGSLGVNNVTLRATDASGNFSTCAATVTVKDVTAPNALCKNTTVTLNDVGQGTLSVNQLNNGSSDACGIATMTLSKTQFNCSDIPGSSQSVTLTLKDVNNNQSSCTAQVTTKDNLAPTAICQNTTVHLGANGQVTVYPADLAANSYDNCSVTSHSPTAKVYTTANLGNNSLSITVKDWSGNSASCVSVVTVQPFTGLRGSGGDRSEGPESVPTEGFSFNVYPNPTVGDATLDFELAENQSVALRMFDLAGRVVLTQNLEGVRGSNQARLEMAPMPNGVYVVEIQADNVRRQKRLVVHHD